MNNRAMKETCTITTMRRPLTRVARPSSGMEEEGRYEGGEMRGDEEPTTRTSTQNHLQVSGFRTRRSRFFFRFK